MVRSSTGATDAPHGDDAMTFREFAKTQDVTPTSPMIDIFDVAQMYYEEFRRPIPNHTDTADWWEAAENFAERICSWYPE